MLIIHKICSSALAIYPFIPLTAIRTVAVMCLSIVWEAVIRENFSLLQARPNTVAKAENFEIDIVSH